MNAGRNLVSNWRRFGAALQLFLAAPSFAITISVTVTREPDATPVADTLVTLKHLEWLKTSYLVTDSVGRVEFRDISAGAYHLAAETRNLVGSRTVRVDKNMLDLMEVSLELVPVPSSSLQPIAIKAPVITSAVVCRPRKLSLNEVITEDQIVCQMTGDSSVFISPAKVTRVSFYREHAEMPFLPSPEAFVKGGGEIGVVAELAVYGGYVALLGVLSETRQVSPHSGYEAIIFWSEGEATRTAIFHLDKRNYREFLDALRKVTGRDWTDFDASREASELRLVLKERVRLGEDEMAPGAYSMSFWPREQGLGTLYIHKQKGRTVAKGLVELDRKAPGESQSPIALKRTESGAPALCEIRTPQYVFRFQECKSPK